MFSCNFLLFFELLNPSRKSRNVIDVIIWIVRIHCRAHSNVTASCQALSATNNRTNTV